MSTAIPTATKEYPLYIQVPEADERLWTTILKNEEKLRALFEGDFFNIKYGKALVSFHDDVVVTISLDTRTYQRVAKNPSVIHIVAGGQA